MNTPRAEPLYFGSDERPLFGWLHRPAAPGDLGVVICNPFGHKEQNVHRSLRHFAEAAAQAGVPALRFDWDGTGDSAGDDSDPQRVAAWIASIHRALETLRDTTGVSRVALFGLRLGALLAGVAATETPEVACLILLAPVIAGKPWLREMRALQGALDLQAPPADAPPFPEGTREAVGFLLTSETQDALAKLDLSTLEKAPAPQILLLDRDDFPSCEKLAAHFSALGAQVTHSTAPGYADMMRDPHESQVPEQLVEQTQTWLREHAGAINAPAERKAVSRPPSAIVAPQCREHAVFLDEGQRLFGIVSEPLSERKPRAVLLINSGANHRVGPNRLYVKIARHLAQNGYLTLRMDIAGLGDSLAHDGEEEHVVYAPRAVDDVRAAIDYLKTQWDAETVRAGGICSGAYHSFKAAVAGAELDGVILINPLTFFWKPGMSLDLPNSQVIAEAARYQQSMFQADKWKRLLTGKADARAVAQVVTRRAADIAGRGVQKVAKRAGYRPKDDLAAELESLAARNIDMRFIFSLGDPGLTLLAEGGGATVSRLEESGHLAIQCLEGPDHTFTPVWTHSLLIEAVHDAVK